MSSSFSVRRLSLFTVIPVILNRCFIFSLTVVEIAFFQDTIIVFINHCFVGVVGGVSFVGVVGGVGVVGFCNNKFVRFPSGSGTVPKETRGGSGA